MITNNDITSGALALAMGVEPSDLAEPGRFETPEEAYLRTAASQIYLKFKDGENPRLNVYASNCRPKFACYVPAPVVGVNKESTT